MGQCLSQPSVRVEEQRWPPQENVEKHLEDSGYQPQVEGAVPASTNGYSNGLGQTSSSSAALPSVATTQHSHQQHSLKRGNSKQAQQAGSSAMEPFSLEDTSLHSNAILDGWHTQHSRRGSLEYTRKGSGHHPGPSPPLTPLRPFTPPIPLRVDEESLLAEPSCCIPASSSRVSTPGQQTNATPRPASANRPESGTARSPQPYHHSVSGGLLQPSPSLPGPPVSGGPQSAGLGLGLGGPLSAGLLDVLQALDLPDRLSATATATARPASLLNHAVSGPLPSLAALGSAISTMTRQASTAGNAKLRRRPLSSTLTSTLSFSPSRRASRVAPSDPFSLGGGLSLGAGGSTGGACGPGAGTIALLGMMSRGASKPLTGMVIAGALGSLHDQQQQQHSQSMGPQSLTLGPWSFLSPDASASTRCPGSGGTVPGAGAAGRGAGVSPALRRGGAPRSRGAQQQGHGLPPLSAAAAAAVTEARRGQTLFRRSKSAGQLLYGKTTAAAAVAAAGQSAAAPAAGLQSNLQAAVQRVASSFSTKLKKQSSGPISGPASGPISPGPSVTVSFAPDRPSTEAVNASGCGVGLPCSGAGNKRGAAAPSSSSSSFPRRPTSASVENSEQGRGSAVHFAAAANGGEGSSYRAARSNSKSWDGAAAALQAQIASAAGVSPVVPAVAPGVGRNSMRWLRSKSQLLGGGGGSSGRVPGFRRSMDGIIPATSCDSLHCSLVGRCSGHCIGSAGAAAVPGAAGGGGGPLHSPLSPRQQQERFAALCLSPAGQGPQRAGSLAGSGSVGGRNGGGQQRSMSLSSPHSRYHRAQSDCFEYGSRGGWADSERSAMIAARLLAAAYSNRSGSSSTARGQQQQGPRSSPNPLSPGVNSGGQQLQAVASGPAAAGEQPAPPPMPWQQALESCSMACRIALHKTQQERELQQQQQALQGQQLQGGYSAPLPVLGLRARNMLQSVDEHGDGGQLQQQQQQQRGPGTTGGMALAAGGQVWFSG